MTAAGTPVWRVKYRYPDLEKGLVERLYSIGVYPEVSLEAARTERDEIRAKLREGRDPMQVRQLNKAAAAVASGQTFEGFALEWLTHRQGRKNWSPGHYEKSKQAIERDVFPLIGKLPVAEITPAMIAAVIEKIAKRGVIETASKIYEHVRSIFRLAQARGLRQDNPADPVREVLPMAKKTAPMPALLTFPALGDLLRRAESSRMSPAIRMAHRLCAFPAPRISNIVQAEWPEFDLEADVPTWIIPRKKMKSKDRTHDHKIILGEVIAEELREWRRNTVAKGFIFPSSADGGHIVAESLEKAYRETLALRGKHTPHSWRSSLSTLARDNGFERDVVEITLDHIHDNDVARAYDRGERLQQRVKLMNWWCAKLVNAQHGAKVTPIKAA